MQSDDVAIADDSGAALLDDFERLPAELVVAASVERGTPAIERLEILAVTGLDEHAVTAEQRAAVDILEGEGFPGLRYGGRRIHGATAVVLSADEARDEHRLQCHAGQRQRRSRAEHFLMADARRAATAENEHCERRCDERTELEQTIWGEHAASLARYDRPPPDDQLFISLRLKESMMTTL